MRVATVNLDRVAREMKLTIKVRGAKRLALRLTLAALIIRLAVFVAGLQGDVEVTAA